MTQQHQEEERLSGDELIGRKKFAEILREARGDMSIRDFARLVGLSHMTISNLERAKGGVDSSSLNAIAPYTPFSPDELRAICENREPSIPKNVRLVEDMLPLVSELPEAEQVKLIVTTLRRLAVNNKSVIKKIMTLLIDIL